MAKYSKVWCTLEQLCLHAGLVGIVPALGMMTTAQNPGGPIVFPWWKLMLWSLALAFLGVFIAVPLRTQTVIKVRPRRISI